MKVRDKYSLEPDVIPISTTPRFLFADHTTDNEKSFRFFIIHTQSPRIIVEVKSNDEGKLQFQLSEQTDPIKKDEVAKLMSDLGEFAVEQMNLRILP